MSKAAYKKSAEEYLIFSLEERVEFLQQSILLFEEFMKFTDTDKREFVNNLYWLEGGAIDRRKLLRFPCSSHGDECYELPADEPLYYSSGSIYGLGFQLEVWRRADQGRANAQFFMGSSLLELDLLEPDRYFEEGVKWLEKAAKQGHFEAQLLLAERLVSREGNENWSRGRKWYVRAAEQGSAEALFQLGKSCDNGFGVKEDMSQAKKYYIEAADKGHKEARLALGLYEYQHPIKRDPM
ncbi:sel1 repeat family protein [bacterium]|jgi:TPR repeat protein|nr:sel1 repeat family protein [bacterium]